MFVCGCGGQNEKKNVQFLFCSMTDTRHQQQPAVLPYTKSVNVNKFGPYMHFRVAIIMINISRRHLNGAKNFENN